MAKNIIAPVEPMENLIRKTYQSLKINMTF